MAADDPKPSYVERVRANTRAYIEEILAENARLRAAAERTEAEQTSLGRQVVELRAELARRDHEHRTLLALCGRVEAETRRFEERFAEVEQQNSNLASLYAASYQLHASLERAEVLATIQEIVVNLIGSEELAVLAPGASGFAALGSMGVDAARLATLRSDVGLVARALASGQPAAAGPEGAGEDGVTACIPLTVGGRTLALVAIFRLLPQKPELQGVDMELFSLLAHHAATALYCAELHETHLAAGVPVGAAS